MAERMTTDEYIREIVDAAPPLTEYQRARLATLLLPASGPASNLAVAPPRREPAPAPRVALYRHFDEDGVLLYVGITSGLSSRGRGHARYSVWADFAARAEAQWFDTRGEAEAAEIAAIKAERPLFNGTHATAEAKRACVEYLVKRDRIDLLGLSR